MIKQLLFIGAIVFASAAGAQTIPNGGFENWTDNGLYEDPDQWVSLNFFALLGAPETATKSTDAHSGTYAAQLQTVAADVDGDGNNDTIPSSLSLGTLDLMSGESTNGAAFTSRPDSLTGWYKFAPLNADAFVVQVSLTKWNAVSGEQETVASGTYTQDAAASVYRRMSFPLVYESTDIPDTVSVTFITAGGMTTSPGTALWIDDLAFVTNSPLAVIPKPAEPAIQLYPNPAKESVNVVLAKDANIHICNALGMEVDVMRATASKTLSIPTAKYDNGVYLLKTDTGIVQRFVVKH